MDAHIYRSNLKSNFMNVRISLVYDENSILIQKMSKHPPVIPSSVDATRTREKEKKEKDALGKKEPSVFSLIT